MNTRYDGIANDFLNESELLFPGGSSLLKNSEALDLYVRKISENIKTLKVQLIMCEQMLNLRGELLREVPSGKKQAA